MEVLVKDLDAVISINARNGDQMEMGDLLLMIRGQVELVY